jgi:hypothetical protein
MPRTFKSKLWPVKYLGPKFWSASEKGFPPLLLEVNAKVFFQTYLLDAFASCYFELVKAQLDVRLGLIA